jgi:hypothetical protein
MFIGLKVGFKLQAGISSFFIKQAALMKLFLGGSSEMEEPLENHNINITSIQYGDLKLIPKYKLNFNIQENKTNFSLLLFNKEITASSKEELIANLNQDISSYWIDYSTVPEANLSYEEKLLKDCLLTLFEAEKSI